MGKHVIILTLLICSGVWYSHHLNDWVDYDKSHVVRKEPVQTATHKKPFDHKGYTITPKAQFDIEARLLSKKYYSSDAGAKLSPMDFALGWGPMSSYNVISQMKIWQSGRWYKYRYEEPPLPLDEIVSHSANMHLIPANEKVLKTIKQARKGQVVRIRGQLVWIKGPKGWYWNSSLTRTDRGGSSCEVIWVERIEIVS